jgi:hypothetical protein
VEEVVMKTVALIVMLASTPAIAEPRSSPLASPMQRVHPDRVEAASYVATEWTNYHPSYVTDDDPATAWVASARGPLTGEWLRLYLSLPPDATQLVLRIRNGCQTSRDAFRANARAMDVTLRLFPLDIELRPYVQGRSLAKPMLDKRVTLEDRLGWQRIVVDRPGNVRAIELAIESVHHGATYHNLCISDVQVLATPRARDIAAEAERNRKALMHGRASREAAARLAQARVLPIYPAYEVTTTQVAPTQDPSLAALLAFATKDPSFHEWKDALAIATATVAAFDRLPLARVTPTAQHRLVAVDGLMVEPTGDNVWPDSPSFYPDHRGLHLPMFDHVSVLFADQLRIVDVAHPMTVNEYFHGGVTEPCQDDVAWVKRSPPADACSPGRVEAIVFGHCQRSEIHDGWLYERAIELNVYDATGRLVFSAGGGHINCYRWVDDNGHPMLAGGVALVWAGKRVDVRKHGAVMSPLVPDRTEGDRIAP